MWIWRRAGWHRARTSRAEFLWMCNTYQELKLHSDQRILIRYQQFVHVFLTATPATYQHKPFRIRIVTIQYIPFRVKLTEDPNQLNGSAAHLLVIICQQLAGLKEDSQPNISKISPFELPFTSHRRFRIFTINQPGQIKKLSLLLPTISRFDQTSPKKVN